MAPAPRGTLPVRRRKEDVPLLVNGPHVAGGYGGTGRDVASVSDRPTSAPVRGAAALKAIAGSIPRAAQTCSGQV